MFYSKGRLASSDRVCGVVVLSDPIKKDPARQIALFRRAIRLIA